jgi:SNF2 family DNA or RNA helicase
MTATSHRCSRWWQEGIESQAVDRVNRIGQKKPVHVYQLIADDTVESKVLDIQEKKKTLIKQVRNFSLRSGWLTITL